MQSLSKAGLTRGKPLDAMLWHWGGPPVLTDCGARELLGLELIAPHASAPVLPFVRQWTGRCSKPVPRGRL